jgi:phosphate transport system permease protein
MRATSAPRTTLIMSTPLAPDTVLAPEDNDRPIAIAVRRPLSDRVYRSVAYGGGFSTLVIMGLIGAFLLVKSLPALRQANLSFLTETRWVPQGGHFGILAVLVGTVMIASVACVLAIPMAIGASLFITEYSPRWLRRPLTSLVDLLAAIPSLIYGLWGRVYLQPKLLGVARWLTDHLGFIPFFHTNSRNFTASAFIAGVVVSLMVLPIATAVMREVFAQAPPGEKEGALALGATRWAMVRTVVLPFGRGGIIGGSMLGLGRALGETIAVTLIVSPLFKPSVHILQTGTNSFSALIALRFGEANAFGISALMAAGLALFVMTLVVNALASIVVSHSRSGTATEI